VDRLSGLKDDAVPRPTVTTPQACQREQRARPAVGSSNPLVVGTEGRGGLVEQRECFVHWRGGSGFCRPRKGREAEALPGRRGRGPGRKREERSVTAPGTKSCGLLCLGWVGKKWDVSAVFEGAKGGRAALSQRKRPPSPRSGPWGASALEGTMITIAGRPENFSRPPLKRKKKEGVEREYFDFIFPRSFSRKMRTSDPILRVKGKDTRIWGGEGVDVPPCDPSLRRFLSPSRRKFQHLSPE